MVEKMNKLCLFKLFSDCGNKLHAPKNIEFESVLFGCLPRSVPVWYIKRQVFIGMKLWSPRSKVKVFM